MLNRRLVSGIQSGSSVLALFASFILVCLSGLVFVAVIARYFFNKPLVFVDEVGGYMFLVIVFLGLAHVTKINEHIRVELVVSRLPDKMQELATKVAIVLAISFTIFFLLAVFRLAWSYYFEHTVHPGSLGTPLWLPAGAMVIGAAFMLL